MGERADEPDKIEKPEASNSPAGEPSAGPGGSTENNLPVVWSPKLDAGGGFEDEFLDADAAPSPPYDEAPHDEAAKSEESETAAPAAPAAPQRSWRFALLAATIALAAAVGSFVGSLTGAGVGRIMPEAALSTADASSILRAMKTQLAELSAMKSNLDSSVRNANTQFVAIAERLDRVERAATNPAAQLAHIADAVDRLNKINAAPETTGSIAPMTTPPAEAKITDRLVEDWVVQDVHGDRALVESRNGSLFEVGAGSILPGVGKVEAVKRQDGQWVVVTARGVITSGR
jgi:hypothetical protein